MKCAVIDVGSNTIRLSVYKTEGQEFNVLFSEKAIGGLAGYIKNGAMTRKGILRACEALDEFKQLLNNFDIDRTAVFATASLRNISNTEEVLEAIEKHTGYCVEVISGHTEAMLSYYGALSQITVSSGILLDIGGGSTEVVSFGFENHARAVSMPIGSLNLFSRNVSKFLPKKHEQTQILTSIHDAVKEANLDDFPQSPYICAVGGTARALLKIVNAVYDSGKENRIITLEQLEEVHDILRKHDAAARKLILKNCPDRVHTIIPGMLILNALMKKLGGRQIIVSRYGVREGYLCHRILKTP